jgi:5-methylcytosine-specific restriction endonuclease McrA
VLLKECRRCGNLIPYGSTYCQTCTPIVEAYRKAQLTESKRKANRKYNQTRDKKYIQFYNSQAWRTLSAKYTQDKQYKCECCRKIATQVHHKQAIQTEEGWDRRLDYDNLELLCVDCHNERHNRFSPRG